MPRVTVGRDTLMLTILAAVPPTGSCPSALAWTRRELRRRHPSGWNGSKFVLGVTGSGVQVVP